MDKATNHSPGINKEGIFHNLILTPQLGNQHHCISKASFEQQTNGILLKS